MVSLTGVVFFLPLIITWLDTGETKKQLCLSLGAEKWVDFMESKNVIDEVKAATDGQGPDAAVIAAGDVSQHIIPE